MDALLLAPLVSTIVVNVDFFYVNIFESSLHELDQGHASAKADFKRIVEAHEERGKKS